MPRRPRHEPPEDVNNWTKTSVRNLAGQGFIVAARDGYPRDGQTRSFVAGFAEVEVDVETGAYSVLDYTAIGDSGTINAHAAWSVRNAEALGVMYVIWYRQVWVPGVGWHAYRGRGDPSSEHTNHVHVSML